ncbi:hypothetical protein Q9Q99_00395 [Curtobacterium flaccumfaciens]|nr:hypothetical protein Q9Q99_00395 [Curtobacterium flaccumfaciens]
MSASPLASVFGAGIVAVGISVVVLVVIAVNSLAGVAKSSAATPEPACPAVASKTIGGMVVPAGPVAGFCQDRLVNAAHVIEAAQALGIGPAHAGRRRDDRDR